VNLLRGHLYRLQETQASAILTERGVTMNATAAEMYRSLVSKAVEAANRYEREKKEIEDKAKELEHERDEFRAKDPYFERAAALLQIAMFSKYPS
jgi:predicted ribosome quality control (RQC) complex YloA/Tae2 family protein